MLIDTRREQLRVLRQQQGVPSAMLTTIEQHLDREDEIAAARYRPDAQREHLATLKNATMATLNAALDALPAEARAWYDAEMQKLPTPGTPYSMSAADALILETGTPEDLEALVEQSGHDPVIKRAVVLRLEALYRQQPNRMRDAAFAALTRLRPFLGTTPDHAAQVRDLESAVARWRILRRDAILRAAAIADISAADLSRAQARASASNTA